MRHIALGVNIGNLSRGKRPREPMLSRCHRINQNLAGKGVDLRVVGFYRHTGNLVLETVSLCITEAANLLSEADGATWMAVSEATMRKAVENVREMPPPDNEGGVRWTPGLAFAVTKPAGTRITSTGKVRLRSIDKNTVAAWKRDRITERGRLDNRMREGGWGPLGGDRGSDECTMDSAQSYVLGWRPGSRKAGERVKEAESNSVAIAHRNGGEILSCASMNEIGRHDSRSHERATFGSPGCAAFNALEFITIATPT